MVEITTTRYLDTERARKALIQESSHLIELFDEVILECPNGTYKYNFLKDLFVLGEQKNIISGGEERGILKVGEDKFEIHHISKEWTSTIVNAKTLVDLSRGKLSFADLEWV